MDMMDRYCGGISVLIIGCVEIIVLSWIYGAKRLARDVKLMIGREPGMFIRVLWKFLAPLGLTTITIAGLRLFMVINHIFHPRLMHF